MHAALTSHAKFQEFEQRLTEAEALAAAADEQDRKNADAYQAAIRALGPGDPFPPAPTATAEAGWIHRQRSTIREDRAAWLAENYDEIVARFAKAEDTLIAKATKAVAALDEITAELEELSSCANFVTTITCTAPMIHHGAADLAGLIAAAVRTGGHLFREPYAIVAPGSGSHVADRL